MIELVKCVNKSQPRLWIDRKIYYKARRLYSKRRGFIKIEPIMPIIKDIVKDNYIEDVDNLWSNYNWYEHKNRVFIFKKGLPIASFVIKDNKAYNPLIACGGVYSSVYKEIFKMPWFIYLIASLYEDDIELLRRERK